MKVDSATGEKKNFPEWTLDPNVQRHAGKSSPFSISKDQYAGNFNGVLQLPLGLDTDSEKLSKEILCEEEELCMSTSVSFLRCWWRGRGP